MSGFLDYKFGGNWSPLNCIMIQFISQSKLHEHHLKHFKIPITCLLFKHLDSALDMETYQELVD